MKYNLEQICFRINCNAAIYQIIAYTKIYNANVIVKRDGLYTLCGILLKITISY